MKFVALLLLIILSFLLFPYSSICQQPTKQQIEKMKQQFMQKMMDSMMKKGMSKNNPFAGAANSSNQKKALPGSLKGHINRDSLALTEIVPPKRLDKVLVTLPKKTFSKAELATYLGNMKKKILPTLKRNNALDTVTLAEVTDASGISNAAVMTYLKGDPSLALSLSLRAAAANPDDPSSLSNLGAFLNINDYPSVAIPILEYLNQVSPGSSTVNNNLGQAYICLGDIERGEACLKDALVTSPDHPNANLTLAYIAITRGDNELAKKYCEASIAGGFIPKAWELLQHIEKANPAKYSNPKNKSYLINIIHKRYKQPETFNPGKYPLPPQCRKAKDADSLTMLYGNYQRMIMDEKQKYEKLANAEQAIEKKKPGQVMNKMNPAVSQLKNNINPNNMDMSQLMKNSRAFINASSEMMKIMPGSRPFGLFAMMMVADIEMKYIDEMHYRIKRDSTYKESVRELKENYDSAYAEITRKFAPRYDKAGEGNPDPTLERDYCNDVNKVAESTMEEMAGLTEDWQKKNISDSKDFFNDIAYWSYVASADDHAYRAGFYGLAEDYLIMLENIATTHFLGCAAHYDYGKEKADSLSFEEVKCPFKEVKIKVEKIDGEIGFDCEKLGINIGLGKYGKFSVEHSLVSGYTTISIGYGMPIIPYIVDGSNTWSIVLGPGGKFIDASVVWEANMDLSKGGGIKTMQAGAYLLKMA